MYIFVSFSCEYLGVLSGVTWCANHLVQGTHDSIPPPLTTMPLPNFLSGSIALTTCNYFNILGVKTAVRFLELSIKKTCVFSKIHPYPSWGSTPRWDFCQIALKTYLLIIIIRRINFNIYHHFILDNAPDTQICVCHSIT